MDQLNRIESPERNPPPLWTIKSLTIEARLYNGKKRVFSASGFGKVEQLHVNQ